MEEILIKSYKQSKPLQYHPRCCESREGFRICCDPRLGYDPIETHIVLQYSIRGSS